MNCVSNNSRSTKTSQVGKHDDWRDLDGFDRGAGAAEDIKRMMVRVENVALPLPQGIVEGRGRFSAASSLHSPAPHSLQSAAENLPRLPAQTSSSLAFSFLLSAPARTFLLRDSFSCFKTSCEETLCCCSSVEFT